MTVYVDFDRTLFDCDRFLDDFYSLIMKYNINRNSFKECQNRSRRCGFNPYTILSDLEQKTNFDKSIYHDIDKLISNTSNYLYPDAIPFLKYLKELDYKVVILTKGNKEYQKSKIANANIDKYYDKIIVTMRHKGFLFLNYVQGIFIDDNPSEINSLMKRRPKKMIRIKRINSKYSNIQIKYDVLNIENLQEIIDKKIIE